MNIFKKFARSVRGYSSEGSLEHFYGAIASRNHSGGPQYRESKRDFEALHGSNDRYLLF